MSHTILDKAITIAAPPQPIFAILTTPVKLKEMQPFVTDVGHVENGVDAQNRAFCDYTFTEALNFAGVSFQHRSSAHTVIVEPDRELLVEVNAGIGVLLNFYYQLEFDGQATRVTQHIDLNIGTLNPFQLLESYIIQQASDAHDTTLKNLKATIENELRQ